MKEALGGEDSEQIQSTTAALAQAAMKIGEAIYAAQQSAGGDDTGGEAGPGEAAASSDDENVVDADFEEVKDDKKKSA